MMMIDEALVLKIWWARLVPISLGNVSSVFTNPLGRLISFTIKLRENIINSLFMEINCLTRSDHFTIKAENNYCRKKDKIMFLIQTTV